MFSEYFSPLKRTISTPLSCAVYVWPQGRKKHFVKVCNSFIGYTRSLFHFIRTQPSHQRGWRVWSDQQNVLWKELLPWIIPRCFLSNKNNGPLNPYHLCNGGTQTFSITSKQEGLHYYSYRNSVWLQSAARHRWVPLTSNSADNCSNAHS